MNRITIFLLALGAAASASALSITGLQPGNLKNSVPDPAAVTELSLSGNVDASDLFFIAREMPALTTLDLREAVIREYKGDRLAGRTTYPAAAIPANVFAGMNITTLALPAQEGLSVGDGSFSGIRIKSLQVGSNVTELGDAAFAACPLLESVTLAVSGVGIGTFAGCPALRSVTFTVPATIDANAFAEDAALATLSGTENITEIGARAFEGCSALTKFDFGNSVTAIGDAAFARSGLRAVNLSKTPAPVGHWAFAECPSLATADLSGIVAGGDGVVFDCPVLVSFVGPGSDTVEPYTFALSTALPSDALIPDGTVRIGAHALHGLTGVTELTLPDGIEEIGDGAMAGMSGLTEIKNKNAQVPALGRDVWAGVDQANVRLVVPDGTADAYQSADQWREFNVMDENMADGGNDPVTELGRPTLRGRFVGDELQVEATGAEIVRLALHDVAGIMLMSVEPAAEQVSLDLSDLTARVFIVAAELSDGTRATLKLARR